MLVFLQIAVTAILLLISCFLLAVVNKSAVQNNKLRKSIDRTLDNLAVLLVVVTVVSGATFLITAIWS
jgi:hypothetical protein